jgi:hypothetical protein
MRFGGHRWVGNSNSVRLRENGCLGAILPVGDQAQDQEEQEDQDQGQGLVDQED